LKLTDEKVFVLYKDILREVEPEKSLKGIAKDAMNRRGKPYTEVWMCKLLNGMCGLNILKKVLADSKFRRYMRTQKGDRILNAARLDDLRKRG
jgi:hypothetical protein